MLCDLLTLGFEVSSAVVSPSHVHDSEPAAISVGRRIMQVGVCSPPSYLHPSHFPFFLLDPIGMVCASQLGPPGSAQPSRVSGLTRWPHPKIDMVMVVVHILETEAIRG
jgi:hypothetical protein